jgi:hypothetical protein
LTYKAIGQRLGLTRQRVTELWEQAQTARPTTCWCGNVIPLDTEQGRPRTYCSSEHAPYGGECKEFTRGQYEEMLSKQGGVCAICRRLETAVAKNGNTIKLAVDHCHETGIIRELLCSSCNKMLGHFDDDPERMERAAEYLREHG